MQQFKVWSVALVLMLGMGVASSYAADANGALTKAEKQAQKEAVKEAKRAAKEAKNSANSGSFTNKMKKNMKEVGHNFNNLLHK